MQKHEELFYALQSPLFLCFPIFYTLGTRGFQNFTVILKIANGIGIGLSGIGTRFGFSNEPATCGRAYAKRNSWCKLEYEIFVQYSFLNINCISMKFHMYFSLNNCV